MWKVVKIKVEPLLAATFAPYGHLIRSFEEREPDKVKGGYKTGAYTAISFRVDPPREDENWYAQNPNRVPLSEGLQRAHFAFHTDAGQSFFPSKGRPSVFLVGGVGQTMPAEQLRAFYSDGSLGVCLHLGVWHTMPICVDGEDVYQTMRGNQDYHAHSVEVEYDLQQGLAIEPDMENFDPNGE